MPKIIPEGEKQELIRMMQEGMSQRQICEQTGFSREFVRKLGRERGFFFPINGVDIKPDLCMCYACGTMMRRPASRVTRSSKLFCSVSCRAVGQQGENNSNYKDGSSSRTFSEWLYGQADYKAWRQAVLERDNFTCQITGLPADDCHHVKPKAEFQHLALDVSNGIAISKEGHRLVHQLIREGYGFEEAIEEAKRRMASQETKEKNK